MKCYIINFCNILAPIEVNNSKNITVNGKTLENTEAQIIGEPDIEFIFSIKEACVASPDINFWFNKSDGSNYHKPCKEQFECREMYEEEGSLYVIVTVPGYGNDMRFPSTGFYEIMSKPIYIPGLASL